jgi:membrane protein
LAGFIGGLLVGAAVWSRSSDARSREPIGRAARAPLAGGPWDLSLRAWRAVIVGSVRQFGQDRIPAAAAGTTFFVLLALFPAISAFVSLYGLVSNVADAERQVTALGGLVPGGAFAVVGGELTRLTQTSHNALGFAFAVSLAISIWSANAGMKSLTEGLNVAYDTSEHRGFLRLTLLSLAFTLGAIVLAVAGLSFAVAAPDMAARWGFDGGAVLGWLRWPLILAVVVVTFSLLYRLGPCRPGASWVWITPGSVFAAIAWMATSGLFSWYVANFGHYNATYGSLGAIVGFLTWVWLSLMVLLLGAELNRQIEKQAAS